MTNQNNFIQETDINTRKELWNTLFCWVDFSKTEWKNKVYNQDYSFLPLPQTFVDWQKHWTQFFITKHSELENLIAEYQSYFQENIYPILKSKEGDKTLLFRCERLFENKMIGETSSLLTDLLIFELEYRQQQAFKELLTKLTTITFTEQRINNLWQTDLTKLKEGRINYEVSHRFWFKWSSKIENQELVPEVNDYLKLWQTGKGATSQWKNKLDNFTTKLEHFCNNKEQSQHFFTFGAIKEQSKEGIVISTQNSKGWDLNNPYLMLFWFHQKPQEVNPYYYRSYFVEKCRMINPRNLYVELTLRLDWNWKNYGKSVSSSGVFKSETHPIYHEKNLPVPPKEKLLHFPFCQDLGDKEVYYLDTNFQPKWQLYTINHPNMIERWSDNLAGMMRGRQFYADFYDSPMKFPSNLYKVEKYDDWWTGLNKNDLTLLLLPDDFYKGKSFLGVGTKVSSSFYEKKDIYQFYLATEDYSTNDPIPIDPKIIKEITDNLTNWDHLISHATFQFCFNQETMFAANLRYLDFKKENEKWIVKYLLKIKATPAGIYYTFLSKNILWQLKLEIKQTVASPKTLKSILGAAMVVATITGAFMLAGAIGIGGAGLADGSALNSINTDLSKIKQTNQLLQGAKSVLPDDNENISYSFSLFDFWSKLRKRPFWGKIYVSNTLKNNLLHNNNENSINYPLNITFDKFYKILKKGDYRGELKLTYDPNRFLASKFKEGITFFEDMKKDFITPELGLKGATNLIVYNLENAGGWIGEEIRDEDIAEVDRVKRNNYHQRAHYFIHYEDGTNEHWLVLFPKSFKDSDLANGHTHGGFTLKFDKPVQSFHDVYTCIGCGARDQGYNVLHSDYDKGSADSLDIIHKNLDYEPWFSEFTSATLQKGAWKCPNGKCLGADYDVWEQQEEKKPDGKSFQRAYGYIPSDGVIRWKLGSSEVKMQKIPGHDEFKDIDDWKPTSDSFQNIDIPLSDPEIPISEPSADATAPEADIPTTDIDPTGGEVEIPPLEPEIPEPDLPDNEPDLPEPEVPEPEIIDPDVPAPDSNEIDTTPDTSDADLPPADDIPNDTEEND